MAINVQSVRAQGIYEARATGQVIGEDIRQLEKLLTSIEARSRMVRILSLVFLAAGVVTLIGSMFSPGLTGYGWLLLIAALALFIYSFRVGAQISGQRSRFNVFQQVWATFQHDAPARGPFHVHLLLRSKPELLGVGASKGKNGRQQNFREGWLSFEAPLLDGTNVATRIIQLDRKRTKTNPRGKVKTKTRTRFLVSLISRYPSERYGNLKAMETVLRKDVKVPKSAVVRGVRVSEKAINLKALVSVDGEVAATVGMLAMGSFRVLNFVRRAAAKGGAK